MLLINIVNCNWICILYKKPTYFFILLLIPVSGSLAHHCSCAPTPPRGELGSTKTSEHLLYTPLSSITITISCRLQNIPQMSTSNRNIFLNMI